MQWNHAASATPSAQQTFFAEFLATTGVHATWANGCPLSYARPNARGPSVMWVTWLVAPLGGHNCYAHIIGLRVRPVSPQALGIDKIISDDARLRSLSRTSAEESQTWLAPQLLKSRQAALNAP